MKKLTLFAVAFLFTAFSFAQGNAGQFSFGAGGDFTSPGAGDDDFNANIGYFAIDGLMLSFDFSMGMEYKEASCASFEDPSECTDKIKHESTLEWGGALRYYGKDNLFIEAGIHTNGTDDLDTFFAGGVSLVLGFDGRLWFEPMIKYDMPGSNVSSFGTNESQPHLGLDWAFRYTF